MRCKALLTAKISFLTQKKVKIEILFSHPAGKGNKEMGFKQ